MTIGKYIIRWRWKFWDYPGILDHGGHPKGPRYYWIGPLFIAKY